MVLKDGNTAYASETVTGFGKLAAQNAYQTLQANNVFENKDYLGADEFLDDNGTNNTVDTGSSSDVVFNYNLYEIEADSDSADDNEDITFSQDSNPSSTDKKGYEVDITNNCIITSVRIVGTTTATKAYITNSSGGIISSGTIVGVSATMSPTPLLKAGDTYYVEVDKDGASMNYNIDQTSITFPLSGANIDFISSSSNGGSATTGAYYAIDRIVTQNATYKSSGDLETNEVISLNSAPKSIVVYANKTLPTDTSITVDVSDDGGTTFAVTGGAVNSYIDTTSLSGTSLAIKFNLATTDTSVSPKLFGYAVCVTD